MALGLGEIKVQSALDQPFLAEIPLIQSPDSPVSPEEIFISFGSPTNSSDNLINDAYARSHLSIKIESNIDSPDIIRITSSKFIKEPILQFTVELSWDYGKLYKQYSVLLDPPGLSTPRQSAAAPNTRRTPQRLSGLSNIINPAAYQSTGLTHGKYGPVEYGDTLSDISLGLSAQLNEKYSSLLNAIFFENPAAFINNDINKIRQGSILIIPKTQSVAANSPGSSLAFLNIVQSNIQTTSTVDVDKTDDIDPVQALPTGSTDKDFGLKFSSSISLDRLNTSSSLLQEKDTSEQEIIPKEMIIDSGESVPELKAEIARLEDANTLLEKRLLLLERKIFNDEQGNDDDTEIDVDSRLQSMEKEVFQAPTDDGSEEIIVTENISANESSGINLWLWIPILTAIAFLIFWAFYFYRSSVADTQLRTMLKNRAEHLRETKTSTPSTQTNNEEYVKPVPPVKSHDAYKPPSGEDKKANDDELAAQANMFSEATSTATEEDNSKPEVENNTEEQHPHTIEFTPSNDFKSIDNNNEESKEAFTENHLIEPDSFIEPPGLADNNNDDINAPVKESENDDDAEDDMLVEYIADEEDELEEETEESIRNKALHEAELHIAFEQFDKAEVILVDLVEKYPDDLGYKVKYAQVLLKQDKTSEAKEVVDALLSKKTQLEQKQADILERLSLELFDTPS